MVIIMMKKIALLSLVFVALMTTGCGSEKEAKKENKKEPETVINTEKDVIKDQEVDGLTMSNTVLSTTDGVTTLTVEVKNNSGEDYHLSKINVIVKDVTGNTIFTVPCYIGNVITNGATKMINTTLDVDLNNAVSIEYNIIK